MAHSARVLSAGVTLWRCKPGRAALCSLARSLAQALVGQNQSPPLSSQPLRQEIYSIEASEHDLAALAVSRCGLLIGFVAPIYPECFLYQGTVHLELGLDFERRVAPYVAQGTSVLSSCCPRPHCVPHGKNNLDAYNMGESNPRAILCKKPTVLFLQKMSEVRKTRLHRNCGTSRAIALGLKQNRQRHWLYWHDEGIEVSFEELRLRRLSRLCNT